MDDVIIDSEEFRDAISTVDKRGKRIWVNPKKPKGKFTNYRTALSAVLLLLLFAGPFLRINGHPLMLINIPERKFIIMGVFFGSQDTFLLALSMITGIIFIALFTVIYGRLFCGWVCPQTIFMEQVFRRIEYWIEGDYTRQKALNKAPWNSEKISKRLLKHVIFFLVSFLISNTFLAYIIGTDKLYRYISEGPFANLGVFVALLIFTGIFYFVFSYLREQVCIIVCPYGRMQGVLLDNKSMVVAYDFVRGEKRGNPKKNKNNEPLGDCVDCGQCVNVCPTGIDIRYGTQLECVGCTACIDACDEIMEKIKRPKGLVRYASMENILKGEKFKLNARIIAYSSILVILVSVVTTLLLTRSPMRVAILRAPGSTYQTEADGDISNIYTIKFSSRIFDDFTPEVRLLKPEGKLKVIGSMHELKGGDVGQATVLVTLEKEKIQGIKVPITLGVFKDNKLIEKSEITFFGPINKP
jgi:cytochrome c oxidase accessory protein FixG